ncbi:MAG: SAF domain-containing protein [Atribacterota bacterium]
MWRELLQLEAQGRSIRIGLSGADWLGSGFATEVHRVPGMEVVLMADQDVEKARQVFLSLGYSEDLIVEAENSSRAEDGIRQGKRVVTSSLDLLSGVESVDVVVDATSSPFAGATVAYHAIRNHKTVVLVNIEADATVGRILRRMAEREGVLYTVSSGDEPGCLMELFDFVMTLGFEPVVLGKGKNNPLNPYATPETVWEAAIRQKKNPFQVASYVDGTKTMFEMGCCANATGFVPVRRGMMGPQVELPKVAEVFSLAEDGGMTPFPGIVDFVQSQSMAGGVFVVVRIDQERIREDLEYLKVGRGKYFVFFRPYHLWFLEAPISVARAHLERKPTLTPLDRPVAEVLTVAKRDLKAGESLDGFGGFTFYGVLDKAEIAFQERALPAGLAPGAVMKREVSKGTVITWDDVELQNNLLVRLRHEQDQEDWGQPHR